MGCDILRKQRQNQIRDAAIGAKRPQAPYC